MVLCRTLFQQSSSSTTKLSGQSSLYYSENCRNSFGIQTATFSMANTVCNIIFGTFVAYFTTLSVFSFMKFFFLQRHLRHSIWSQCNYFQLNDFFLYLLCLYVSVPLIVQVAYQNTSNSTSYYRTISITMPIFYKNIYSQKAAVVIIVICVVFSAAYAGIFFKGRQPLT